MNGESHLKDFHVDVTKIQSTESTDHQEELDDLGIRVFNQQDFEEGVAAQVNSALNKKDEQRAARLLNKELNDLSAQLRTKEHLLNATRKQAYFHPTPKFKEEIDKLSKEVKEIKERQSWLKEKLAGPASDLPQALVEQPGVVGLSLQQSALVEKGELTPFELIAQKEKKEEKEDKLTDFEKYLQDQSSKAKKIKRKHAEKLTLQTTVTKKAKLGLASKKEGNNFFDGMSKCSSSSTKNYKPQKPLKRKVKHRFSEDGELSDIEIGDEVDEEERYGDSEEEWKPPREEHGKRSSCYPSLVYIGSAGQESDEDHDLGRIKGSFGVKKKESNGASVKRCRNSAADDGSHKAYLKRLVQVEKEKAMKEESDSGSDMEMDGGYKVPGKIWNKLYRYQKTGVRWMWELHCQRAGGILGDEMGLGKTIQVISFLAGLEHSQLSTGSECRGLGPTLIVCPTTVLHQWVKEFHTWWPQRRVAILHHSGSFTGSESNLIRSIVSTRGVLVTAYSSVLLHQDLLIPQPWHYVILDEGHKIRNPNAQITVACKQNNLKELWSLFDFIFPGKLGTLPDFMQHFSVPIVQGGYSNATQVAVQTAYKCACVLRDTINPYLLRRMKADVKNNLSLPSKSEQVLFCRLTPHQKEVYKEYLESKECNQILSGSFMVFPGLVTLRKICNHPDLSTGGPSLFNIDEEDDVESRSFGFWKRSGKMQVVDSLLRLWKKQGHRVLLFTQSRQMLDILETYVKAKDYTYRRMDGATPIAARQPLINAFNLDSSVFVFLLTTRVGGLGINLTGANRVVIYDPDWNPSTDLQARERAWRIGQLRDVTVYRLLSAGTIEEKIYHRQIFKQFLTNRVLKDPKQRRFFKSNDLFELFTLTDDDPSIQTETSAIFAGTGSNVKVKVKKVRHKNRFDLMKEQEKTEEKDKVREDQEEVKEEKEEIKEERVEIEREEGEIKEEDSGAEDERLNRLRAMAKKLSKKMGREAKRKRESKSDDSSEPGRHKKHKRKHRDAKFEGKRVKGLVKQSTFKAPVGSDAEASTNEQQDDYVLRKLLKKNGIHSVLHHDRIMQSSKADYAIVEMEADRVAKQAVQALKASRSLCQQSGGAAQGVATWTGKVGAGGAPAKPRFGRKKSSTITSQDSTQPQASTDSSNRQHFDGSGLMSDQASVLSSADLLKRMQQRNLNPHELYAAEESDNEDDLFSVRVDANSAVQSDPKSLQLLTDLRNFLAIKSVTNGGAGTDEILTEFSERVPSQQSALFKAMLKEIAVLNKQQTVKMWKLKPAFR